MNVIIDTLIIGLGIPTILTDKFPKCQLTRLASPDSTIQRYRISLKDEDEQSYFNFLQDNCIAMSSNKFYFKMKSDKDFADRMKARIADNNNCGNKLTA